MRSRRLAERRCCSRSSPRSSSARPCVPVARSSRVLAVVGLCDVGANMLFSLATTRGFLSIVSVLAALYPVVTVALAALVLHERVARTQRLGVAGALVGAALITAG